MPSHGTQSRCGARLRLIECDHTQVESRENGATFGLGDQDLLQPRQHLR